MLFSHTGTTTNLMKIDLSQHIMDYVTRFREVALPGIGLFRLVDTSAQFDGYDVLNPPSRSINFTPDFVDTNGRFENFVAGQSNTDLTTAKKAIDHLVITITQSIVESGQATVYPLGKLTQSTSGLTFTDSISPFIIPLQAAKPIELKLLTHKATDKEASIIKSNTDYTLKSPISQPWRWITILLLALAMFLVFKTCLAMQQKSDQSATASMENDDSFFIEDIVDSTQINVETSDKSSEENKPPVRHEMGANHKSKRSIDEVTPEAIDSLLSDPLLATSAPETPVECIIIVGAFNQQRNAIRMMERVEAQGHQVYLGVHGNLTRVGIIFNCQKKDLVAYIQNIRKDFIRDAWYLQPELHVDY